MKETRCITSPLEVREDGGRATIAGYASTFGEFYELWPGYEEQVVRGAFKKTLRENRDSIAVVFDHDPGRVLATMASKTARFSEDEHGLRYEADLDLTDPDGLGAWRKIERGVITKSSFSFETIKQEVEYPSEDDRSAPIRRTLKEVRLWEASPVLWPANEGTVIDTVRCLRSVAEDLDCEIEQIIAAANAGELPSLLTIRQSATTDEPPAEPGDHSDDTPQPEQAAPAGLSIYVARLGYIEAMTK